MSATQVHFEIHTHNGKSWLLSEALDDQDTAKRKAKTLFNGGKFKAVKVTKETYNSADGLFKSLTITSLGHVPVLKRMAEKEDPLKKIQLCRKPTDLYSYEGRRSIRMQLGTTLDHWSITPTELLHEPRYYLKLDNAGTVLQNAIQRTAVEQIQGTEVTVQERMRELHDVIGKAYSGMKELNAKAKVPNLKKCTLAQAAEALKDEHQRTTLLSISLSNVLAEEKDIWSKFTYVLTLLTPGLPGWAVSIADYLFAEMMQTPVIIKGIMQAQNNVSELERLIGLVHLRRGKAAVEGFEVFNTFVMDAKLPNTQTALQQLLLQHMQTSGPLSEGELDKQLDAIVAVSKACEDDLAQDDKFSKDIQAAISQRCEKTLTSHSISIYMAKTNGPLERASRLLKLAPKLMGPAARKQLAKEVEPIFVPYEQQVLIRKGVDNPIAAMGTLRQIQVLVGAAGFKDHTAETFNKALDDMCLALLKTTDLVQKILKSEAEQWEKAMKLLNLLAKATFVEGQSASGIRTTTRDLMRGSNLLDEMMKNATTQQEQVVQLKSFMDLLQNAGMGGGDGKKAMAMTG